MKIEYILARFGMNKRNRYRISMAYPFCKHIDLYWNSEKCWALDTLTGRYIHKSPFLSNFFYKCFIRFTICTKTCRLNKSNLAQWIFKYIYIYLLNIFNSIHLISKHIRFLFKRYQIDDITMNVNTFLFKYLFIEYIIEKVYGFVWKYLN